MENNLKFESNARFGFDRLVYLWQQNTASLVSEGFWHAANALKTMVDFMLQTNMEDENGIVPQALSLYKQKTPNPPTYFDDQGWWALAFMKAYQLPQYNQPNNDVICAAAKIWTDMKDQAWTDEFYGGCWWNNDLRNYKNAITNELFFTLSTRLYLATNDPKYLIWLVKAYDWFVRTGMILDSGLIIDGLNKRDESNPGGTDLHRKTWTYNQGVILGGLVDFDAILRETSATTTSLDPLGLAFKIAHGAMKNLVFYNGVLQEKFCHEATDGTNTCNCNNAQFKGVFMRYLGAFNRAFANRPFQNFIEINATAVWTNRRLINNDFGQVWDAPYAFPAYCKENNLLLLTLQSSGLDALNAAI